MIELRTAARGALALDEVFAEAVDWRSLFFDRVFAGLTWARRRVAAGADRSAQPAPT